MSNNNSSALPTPRHLAPIGLIVTLATAGNSAWAQRACFYSITTIPDVAATPVPSLSMLGVALLAAVTALVAWRRGKFPGARFMALALVTAAGVLANQGSGGLVQQAYAAALSLTNPAGGTFHVSDRFGETVTITNNSGAPLRIRSMVPALTGCTEGSILGVGASCSGVAACPMRCDGGNIVDGQCQCTSGSYNPTDDMCEPDPLPI